MGLRQIVQETDALSSQRQNNVAVLALLNRPGHKTSLFATFTEFDHSMVPQRKALSDIADCDTDTRRRSRNLQEKLVLLCGQTRC